MAKNCENCKYFKRIRSFTSGICELKGERYIGRGFKPYYVDLMNGKNCKCWVGVDEHK